MSDGEFQVPDEYKEESKKIFWVDIPKNPNLQTEQGEWENVATFDTKEEAIKFINDWFDGSSEDGKVNLIIEGRL